MDEVGIMVDYQEQDTQNMILSFGNKCWLMHKMEKTSARELLQEEIVYASLNADGMQNNQTVIPVRNE